MNHQNLYRAASIFAILISIVVILIYAKPFLVPLTFAAILAMLLLPVTKWMVSKGINHVLAIIMTILLLIIFFGLVGTLLGMQISDIASDFSKFQDRIKDSIEQAKQYISQHLGITEDKQQQIIKEKQSSAQGQAGTAASGILSGIGSLLTNIILVMVYIFLMIFFRGRLKGFILKVVPAAEKKNATKIVESAQQVSQKYLTGLFMMIVCLWIMYGIGFTIVGVDKPLLFAVICGLLEIVPFVGNLTGTLLTVAVSFMQGAGTNVVIGILIVYASVQFIQTYILEPLVVGAEVNINPLFTIVGIVAGELLWGIPGMILAIPLLGIFKIVCDHIEALKPYGYLIGQEKQKDSKIKEKIKALKNKFTGSSK